MKLLEFGRRKRRLLLTDDEAASLTEAADQYHMPRSFLILEAIQAGLETVNPAVIPGR